MNTNGGQIIATTTLTMDMGSLNAKSIIKTHPPLTTKASLISLSSGKFMQIGCIILFYKKYTLL